MAIKVGINGYGRIGRNVLRNNNAVPNAIATDNNAIALKKSQIASNTSCSTWPTTPRTIADRSRS